jgi:hypothetical protein
VGRQAARPVCFLALTGQTAAELHALLRRGHADG